MESTNQTVDFGEGIQNQDDFWGWDTAKSMAKSGEHSHGSLCVCHGMIADVYIMQDHACCIRRKGEIGVLFSMFIQVGSVRSLD